MPDELPPHVQDQVDAAAQDNLAMMKFLGEATGAGTESVAAGVDAGLDALVARIADAMQKHRHRSCTHLKSPQPTIVRAWDRPPRLRCVNCEVRTPSPTGDEEFRCDVCGAIDRANFQAQRVEVGPFQLVLGRCGECFETRRPPA